MTDYSRGNYPSLPSGVTDLETNYDATDVTNVATDNDADRVGQLASGEYAIHQFKQTVTGTSVDITWNGQSDLAPSTSPVVLQVYKVAATAGWVELARNSSTAADTDSDLKYTLSAGSTPALADCLAAGVMTCRVWQNYTGGDETYFEQDYFESGYFT